MMKLLSNIRLNLWHLLLLLALASLQSCGGGSSSSGGSDDDTASNNNAPAFTSGNAISVFDGTTDTGYTATATDADGDALGFSLTGGADQTAFTVDSNSGVLLFTSAPDFSSPTDSDSNNSYVVEVGVSDGTDLVVQSVTVTIMASLEITTSSAGVKTIQFDWPAIAGATHYKLFSNPDGASGYNLLQDNLSATSTTIVLPVHLTDWINASYLLEAHDANGKIMQLPAVNISNLMLSSIGYFKASNTDGGDIFGEAISLSADGNTLAIGAYAERSAVSGINGNQVDNSAAGAGAVYVFNRNGNIWNQYAYIKAGNTGIGDGFGIAVSLSDDGNTLAVGADGEDSVATGINGDTDDSAINSGAAYIFSRNNNNNSWKQQAFIKASNTGVGDAFGNTLYLSGDGNTLAVGAKEEDSNATGIGGDQTNNLANGSGAVYMFSRSGFTWSQQAYIKASNTTRNDQFGNAVSLSDDGNVLAVSATLEDGIGTGTYSDQADGVGNSGAVYVFGRNGSSWEQKAYIKANNSEAFDQFGTAVSLSSDGQTLAVGAQYEASGAIDNQADNTVNGSGAVYVFSSESKGNLWFSQGYIKASNIGDSDNFGNTLSLSSNGNILAVGAKSEDSNAKGMNGNQVNNAALNSGAVYMFRRNGSVWSQQSYVKANNTQVDDRFSFALSMSGDGSVLVVGANLEDSNAVGINGDQTDNTANASGAVYMY